MAWRYKLGKCLQEVRFLYCESSAGSKGVRDFIEKQYYSLKAMNPILPIIVRECDGTRAKVLARYDYNNMRELDLEDMTDKEVENCMKRLVEIGEVMPKCPTAIPRPESVV
ncbi:subunit NDUFA2 [Blastocystis hominis]|uniref:Subunit NDUFA2 n=1 Tax=Blastocystis hominis TaxID=12968 RepID=D8M312_BLAHO|nr:subunit NDUFA2 [Blastocystis hominis]CBK22735.2 subunit NDUFA2 [Blastocystis hominis]|eukprot:XP_012896783.1 subunit NDUFA2 [Blastocystis hominis]